MSDELSNLFARQMVVANPAPIVYSITQHYHHSAHRAPVAVERPVIPEPPRMPLAEDVLLSHNINPQTLFPSQLTLFKQADDDQKRRLIELWQIAPPEYGNRELAQSLQTWPPTNMDREEEMARARYQRMQTQPGQWNNSHESIDCSSPEMDYHAEPYVVSGYEMLAAREYEDKAKNSYSPLGSAVGGYKQSVDPVYQGKEWWVHSQRETQVYGGSDDMEMS